MTMFPDKHYAHCTHCGEHDGMGLVSQCGRGFVECVCGARGSAIERNAFVQLDGQLDMEGFDASIRRAWNTRAGSDGRAELEAKFVDVANRMAVHIEAGNEPPEGMFKERQMWLGYLVGEALKSDQVPLTPGWHAEAAMQALPRGWYWAPFPGDWVWYCPERNMASGLFHGDTKWHELMSKRYWGPWVQPPTEAAIPEDLKEQQ